MDEPVIRGPRRRRAAALGATRGEIKAAHADTRGRFALVDTVFAPGFQGPPPHRHREMHDCFYVIDGALVFQVDGRRVEAGPGTFVAVPPGVVHTFANEGAEPARVLNLFSPGGPRGLPARARRPGAGLGPRHHGRAGLALRLRGRGQLT